MKVECFEDLIAWQKARELTSQIYHCTEKEVFKRDRGLTDQMRRSAVSVMSNIAEGFDRAGRAEFHRFLVIAKGSAAELRSQLYIALDAQYIDETTFSELKERSIEVSRIINGLRKSVKKTNNAAL